jgi:hypothetical protein
MSALAAAVAALVLLAAAHPARAGSATISSPAIYGGPEADMAHCAVRNAGKKPAQVELRIFDEPGTALNLVDANCNGTVQGENTCLVEPGKMFTTRAFVAVGTAYSCSATGKVKQLRGAFYMGCCQIGAPSESYRSTTLR